ncbi:MAG: DedA family protein [Candidatus Riflebacteria bacterium]|nr:DedA family protein [Candidatus Riflebacteria bacterium]
MKIPAAGKAILYGCILLFVVAIWFKDSYYSQIQGMAVHLVKTYGLSTLFILSWLADFIIQPVPPDAFVFAAAFGGANIWMTALFGGLGSSAGGTTGCIMCRCIGARRFCKLFGRDLLRSGKKVFKEHGNLAVFIAAITPIPYSATCWVAGIYGINPLTVFATSFVGRTGRYVFFAWLGDLA